MEKEDQKVLLKYIEDEELLQMVVDRNLVKEAAKDLDDDDLVDMVRARNLEGRFYLETGFDEDVEREKIEAQVENDFEINYHVLHKDFDRFQLRDHLIDIAGLYSHASDKKLFDKLSELLEFC